MRVGKFIRLNMLVLRCCRETLWNGKENYEMLHKIYFNSECKLWNPVLANEVLMAVLVAVSLKNLGCIYWAVFCLTRCHGFYMHHLILSSWQILGGVWWWSHFKNGDSDAAHCLGQWAGIGLRFWLLGRCSLPLSHIVVFLEVIDKNSCTRMRQQEMKWKQFLSHCILQAS